MQAAGSRYILYNSRSAVLKIWIMADIHYANKGCHLALLKKHIKEIQNDPCAYWIGLGDYADYISYDDKRFDPSEILQDIAVADLGNLGQILTSRVDDLFAPIRDKCLGLAYGNHEWRYMRDKDQQGLHQWLCTQMGVPNLGYSFLMNLTFVRVAQKNLRQKVLDTVPDKTGSTRWSLRLYGHHGAGGASTFTGKANRLAKFMQAFDADIYMCAHVHGEQSLAIPRIGADEKCQTLKERAALGVITGSYLKTYQLGVGAGYGERAGYGPSFLGAAVLHVEPDKQKAWTALEVGFGNRECS